MLRLPITRSCVAKLPYTNGYPLLIMPGIAIGEQPLVTANVGYMAQLVRSDYLVCELALGSIIVITFYKTTSAKWQVKVLDSLHPAAMITSSL